VQPNGTTLQANANDAGRLLRFTNAYTHVEGGTVVLSGKAARTGPLLGTLEISSFDVAGEPALARVVATDPNQTIGARRVHFDRMIARFRRTDHVIAVEDALLSGDAVGATFAGRYDLSGAQVDIAGTYIPAYALNTFLSRIPIVGLAFGGTGEGLFGVTFRIAGPISSPEVFFNPLSAVAPGIFRKIFEFQRPTQ
jgi:hypothetical protein